MILSIAMRYNVDSKTYWKIHPKVDDVPKFYGLIKIHKAGY